MKVIAKTPSETKKKPRTQFRMDVGFVIVSKT